MSAPEKKPLNPLAQGHASATLEYTYRWQDVVLYALGIGAKASELGFLYEGGAEPLRVYPTWAVIPAFEACRALFPEVGGDFEGIVHGAQRIVLHRPFAPSGTLHTVGRVENVGDLKRMAQVIYSTRTTDEEGRLVCETEWTIMHLLDGGFGGASPPKSVRVRVPEREPDWTFTEKTFPEQALLYRLTGDHNPLHADPRVAERASKVTQGRPILHGLATYGIIGRAVVTNECGGDPARLRELTGRFSRPVWPGDTLVVRGYREANKILLVAGTIENPDEPVFTNACAELHS
jgi:acyl dehydratase